MTGYESEWSSYVTSTPQEVESRESIGHVAAGLDQCEHALTRQRDVRHVGGPSIGALGRVRQVPLVAQLLQNSVEDLGISRSGWVTDGCND